MERLAPPRSVHTSYQDEVHTYQSLYTARLFVLLAKDAEARAKEFQGQMDQLIGIAEVQKRLAHRLDKFTIWLVALTVVLCFLTGVLIWKGG
jgi:hypothetical protein